MREFPTVLHSPFQERIWYPSLSSGPSVLGRGGDGQEILLSWAACLPGRWGLMCASVARDVGARVTKGIVWGGGAHLCCLTGHSGVLSHSAPVTSAGYIALGQPLCGYTVLGTSGPTVKRCGLLSWHVFYSQAWLGLKENKRGSAPCNSPQPCSGAEASGWSPHSEDRRPQANAPLMVPQGT